MKARITGLFARHRRGHLSDAPLAPFVIASVGDVSLRLRARFMIDTGADFSVVAPLDTLRLFGDDIDFSGTTSDFAIAGIGGVETRFIRMPIQLNFSADDGQRLTKTYDMAVLEPSPERAGEPDGWAMPSLLGRDVLQHFDLHLSYHPPSVSLTEAALSG